MENKNNNQGLDDGYFENNYQPMFNQPATPNWDMSDVPPIVESQDNQANQGNKEKQSAAKKVVTIALVIAMTAGVTVGAHKIGKAQSESLDRAIEREQIRIEQHEKEKAQIPDYVVKAEQDTLVRNQQPEQYYESK